MHNFGTLGQPLLGENKVHPQIYHSGGKGGGGGQNYFYGRNPILLVTEGRMQNFKTLAQNVSLITLPLSGSC